MKREEYITDSQVVKLAKAAVRLEIEKQFAMNNSIAVYDGDSQKIFKENSDGSRTLVGERIRKGRYSERIRKKA